MSDITVPAPELEEVEIEGVSRSAFIMKGALAASAVYGAGMVGPFVGQALAAGGDLEILNFALTLEYLEAAFYKEAQAKVKLSSKTAALAKLFGSQEQQHVFALTKAIQGAGGKPVKAPKVKFPFSNEKAFLKLAQVFEDTGVSAYNGAGPKIKSKAILGAAGSIVQIEARHAAAIRLAGGQFPAPKAFDPQLGTAAVLKAVKPFLA